MSERDELRARLKAFADHVLEDLRRDVTVVGGCALALYDVAERVDLRETQDIDVVVTADSYAQWRQHIGRFEDRGFRFVGGDDAPICRYVKDSLVVDILPSDPTVLSFPKSQWFQDVPNRRMISGVMDLGVVPPALLLALKVEAFADRGSGDPQASKDLEDIVAVMMNEPDIVTTLGAESPELQAFLARFTITFLNDDRGLELFSSHLPGDAATQQLGEDIWEATLAWARRVTAA